MEMRSQQKDHLGNSRPNYSMLSNPIYRTTTLVNIPYFTVRYHRTHIVGKVVFPFQVLYFSILPKGSRLYLSGMANSPSVKSKMSTAHVASTGEWASALCRLAALLLPATGELADTTGAGRQFVLWCWRKCDARSNERTSIFPSQLAHSTNSWTSANRDVEYGIVCLFTS